MAKRKQREPAEQIVGRPRAERPKGLLGALAIRIEALRDVKGMSQPDLARKSGVGLGTVGRLERGQANPHLLTIVSIAEAFGLSARELMQPLEGW